MALQPLSPSILGLEPQDEFILEIANFIHHMISTRPDIPGAQVEVEARIGVLRDRTSGQRLHLPLLVETILMPGSAIECRFESNMSPPQHRHFNNLLNKLKMDSDKPGHLSTPVSYTHLHLVDTYYPSESPRDREKIRVTRDERSGEVRETMKKIKLGDLNIYCPKRGADWRVSVNLEVPCPHPIGSTIFSRKKDRLRYTHEEFTVDLTQVTSTTNTGATEVLHELELEITRSELLLAAAARRGEEKYPELERNAFDDLIHAFVNNARILVRNATDQWQ